MNSRRLAIHELFALTDVPNVDGNPALSQVSDEAFAPVQQVDVHRYAKEPVTFPEPDAELPDTEPADPIEDPTAGGHDTVAIQQGPPVGGDNVIIPTEPSQRGCEVGKRKVGPAAFEVDVERRCTEIEWFRQLDGS